MPTITITADYDGHAYFDNLGAYTKDDTGTQLDIGMGGTIKGAWQLYRSFIKYGLGKLPLGSTVTQVKFGCIILSIGGASHLLDIHAYNSVGQTDPQPDNAQTCYNRCASGNLYYDDGTDFRTSGVKTITLGGSVCTDVQNAKAAVNFFSLALHEELDNDPMAAIFSKEVGGDFIPRLEITYIPPPVVWGGSALPQVQMAKAILGV